jgi:hypothetical protein
MDMGKRCIFSVKSMYKHLFSLEMNNPNKKLWEAKIPKKVKIFMWLICENAILTKDNLSSKNWQVTKDVSSAMFLKALNICSSTAIWLDTSGVLLRILWMLIADPRLLISFGCGWTDIYAVIKRFISLGCQQFAGSFGKLEMLYILKRN